MFYPPKGLCKADTEGGPIIFTYVLFCVRKRILDFQFTGGFLLFETLKMFYFGLGTNIGLQKIITFLRFFVSKYFIVRMRRTGWTDGTVMKSFLFFRWKRFICGWDGTGWPHKNNNSPLFFFILRYIKHYTHIHEYMIYKKKLFVQISCGFKIFVKLGGCPNDF